MSNEDNSNDADVHFVEDLEERKNASGPVTTMAIGEEQSGGWA
jgi:hypothetical protein